MKRIILLVPFVLGLSTAANATGNAEAGKTKSVECAACHGQDGNSLIEMNPKLAGQHEKYLAKQMQDFRTASQTGGKSGRNNAVMNGMAAGLSDQDIADISAYYASIKVAPGSTPENVVEMGEKLYRAGDKERNITACIACHGPKGNGMGLANFPKISDQHAAYIKSQLEAFRSGDRANDLNGMMRDIAAKLTDKDIDILSKYLGRLALIL